MLSVTTEKVVHDFVRDYGRVQPGIKAKRDLATAVPAAQYAGSVGKAGGDEPCNPLEVAGQPAARHGRVENQAIAGRDVDSDSIV